MKHLFFAAVCFWVINTGFSYAQSRVVTIDKSSCQQVIDHVPESDVIYTPGLDVRGNKVAPADLEGGMINQTPETYVFDLNAFLKDDVLSGSSVLTGENSLGHITYDTQSGALKLNDQVLSQKDTQALKVLCTQQEKSHENK